MRGTASLPAIILVLGGCDNSLNQAPGLSASFSADSDGITIHVYAAFLSDRACSGFSLTPCFVELDSGDTLTATAGATTVTLTREAEPPDSGIHYVGSLPQGPGFADVIITYNARGADAVSSRVTLAAPFTVASGIPESFHVGDVLEIVFSPETSPLPSTVTPSFVTTGCGTTFARGPAEPAPGTGGIDLGFEGACVTPQFPPCTDDLPNFWSDPPFDGKGTYHTEFLSPNGPGCDVTVHVRAETGGFVDPHFGESLGFAGLQEQTVKSHILPPAQGSPSDGGSDDTGLPGDAAPDSDIDAGVDAAADAGADSGVDGQQGDAAAG